MLLMLLSLFSLSAHATEFTVTSNAVKPGSTIANAQVFNGMGCKGDNVSPDLHWDQAPAGTKAFAVSVYDPDAPTGSGWWHWWVFNLPATAKGLDLGASGAKGKLPKGAVESRTDFGKAGYGGPCPPVGDKPHRYIFKVFALKDKIPLKSDAPGAMVGFYANSLQLSTASFEATYGR